MLVSLPVAACRGRLPANCKSEGRADGAESGHGAAAAGVALSPWQAALVSTVIVLGGFFGGLVLSAIKRDLGVKDWGRMIEGHGGVLDRLDSVSFAAPLFFHVTRYWFAA